MISTKGVYYYEKRDKDTDEVVESGEVENLVTDDFLYMFYPSWNNTWYGQPYADIILSDTGGVAVDPGEHDLRRLHHANSLLPISNTSSRLSYTIRGSENAYEYSYNFPPLSAGETLSYSYISLRMFPSNSDNGGYRTSLVHLSTPITHDDSTYLYIKYKLYITPNFKSGHNGTGNDFLNKNFEFMFINAGYMTMLPVYYRGEYYRDYQDTSFSNGFLSDRAGVHARLTRNLPAKNPDNIGRLPNISKYLSNMNNQKNDWAANGTRNGFWFGRREGNEYRTTDLTGPIGAVVFGGRTGSAASTVDGVSGTGYSNNDKYWYCNFAQSPVPVGRYASRVFTHAAGSSATFSDASNPPESRGVMTINADGATNHYTNSIIIKFTKSGKASDTPGDPEAGEYYIAYNPYHTSAGFYHNDYSIHNNKNGDGAHALVFGTFDQYRHHQKARWNDPYDNTNIYSIWQETENDEVCICTQYAHSVESAICIESFPLADGELYTGMIVGKGPYSDLVYIACSDGLRVFDMSSKTLTDLTGTIGVDLTDIAWDSVTNMLWAGLQDGVMKIDPFDYTTTEYNSTNSNLSALGDGYTSISAGQLSIVNGVVLRGGGSAANPRYDGYMSNDESVYLQPVSYLAAWVFNSNTDTAQSLRASRDVMGVYLKSETELYMYTRYMAWYGSVKYGYIREFTFADSTWSETGTYSDGLNVSSGVQYTNPYTQLVDTGVEGAIGITFSYRHNNYGYNYHKTCAATLQFKPDTKEIRRRDATIRNDYNEFGQDWRRYDLAWGNTSLRDLYSYGPYYRCPEAKHRRSSYNASRTLFWVDDYTPAMSCGDGLFWDSGLYMGWTGTEWTRMWDAESNAKQIPDTAEELFYGVIADFDNADGITYDKQFVADENMLFYNGQIPIKDDLQKYALEFKYYTVNTQQHTETFTVPEPGVPGAPTVRFSVGAVSNPNFREIDSDSWLDSKTGDMSMKLTSDNSKVLCGLGGGYAYGTAWTKVLNSNGDVVANQRLNVGKNIPSGLPMLVPGTNSGNITTDESFRIAPFVHSTQALPDYYWTVNIDENHIGVAASYEDAMNGITIEMSHRTYTGHSSYIYNLNYSQHLLIYNTGLPEAKNQNTYYPTYDGQVIMPASMAGQEVEFTYVATYY